jgi:alpha-L-fucosidase
MVITAKHHDGFALFDTKVSDWSVMNTKWGKDIIAPLKKNVQDAGLRFGTYYSHALDWGNHGAERGAHWDSHYHDYPKSKKDKKGKDARYDRYLKEIAVPQVKELANNYGKLDLFWWDMPKEMNDARSQPLADALWGAQPHIVANGRLNGKAGKKSFGDFDTHEQSIPAVPLLDKYWESCMTMNHTWGYRKSDHDWKSVRTLIHNLIGVVSKGGNYLLNIGPMPDGSFPQASIDRLREIGDWMDINSESIFGTTATPFLFQQAYRGACTRKEDDAGVTLYLHVFDWPKDRSLEILGVANKGLSAYLLADSEKKPLSVKNNGKVVTIGVPEKAPTQHSSVVVLRVEGELELQEVTGVMTGDGMVLAARDADIQGSQLKYHSHQDGLINWKKSEDRASWPVDFAEGGRYAIQAYYGGKKKSMMKLNIGDREANLRFVPTEGGGQLHRGRGKTSIVGEITVDPGTYTLQLQGDKEKYQQMNIGSLTILPLEDSTQGPDGNISLNVIAAELKGEAPIIDSARHIAAGSSMQMTWKARVTRQTGRFKLLACYSSQKSQQAMLQVGETQYPVTLPATGMLSPPLQISLGEVSISQSGETPITFSIKASSDLNIYDLDLIESEFYNKNSDKMTSRFPMARSVTQAFDKGQHPLAYAGDKALDGNLETEWRPNPKKGKDAWVEIDLGPQCKPPKAIVPSFTGKADFAESCKFELEYLDDTNSWRSLGKIDWNTAKTGMSCKNKKARFWRIKLHYLGWPNIGINEISVQ